MEQEVITVGSAPGLRLVTCPIVVVSRKTNVVKKRKQHHQCGAGFVVEHIRGRLYLMVTCKHAVQPVAEAGDLQVANAFGTPLRVRGEPFLDPYPTSDIAFVLVQWQGTIDPDLGLALHKRHAPRRGSKLYIAQSVCVDEWPLVMWRFSDVVEYQGMDIWVDNESCHVVWHQRENAARMRRKKWLRVRSYLEGVFGGFSGSPVIDEYGSLLGMHFGSVKNGSNSRALCIPVTELRKARKRIDAALQAVLDKQKKPV